MACLFCSELLLFLAKLSRSCSDGRLIGVGDEIAGALELDTLSTALMLRFVSVPSLLLERNKISSDRRRGRVDINAAFRGRVAVDCFPTELLLFLPLPSFELFRIARSEPSLVGDKDPETSDEADPGRLPTELLLFFSKPFLWTVRIPRSEVWRGDNSEEILDDEKLVGGLPMELLFPVCNPPFSLAPKGDRIADRSVVFVVFEELAGRLPAELLLFLGKISFWLVRIPRFEAVADFLPTELLLLSWSNPSFLLPRKPWSDRRRGNGDSIEAFDLNIVILKLGLAFVSSSNGGVLGEGGGIGDAPGDSRNACGSTILSLYDEKKQFNLLRT